MTMYEISMEPALQPLTLNPYQQVMQKRKPISPMPIQPPKALLKRTNWNVTT